MIRRLLKRPVSPTLMALPKLTPSTTQQFSLCLSGKFAERVFKGELRAGQFGSLLFPLPLSISLSTLVRCERNEWGGAGAGRGERENGGGEGEIGTHVGVPSRSPPPEVAAPLPGGR